MIPTPRKNIRFLVSQILLAMGAILLSCAPARATDSWTGAVSGSFAGLNWTAGNNPPHTNDTLNFSSVTGVGGTTLTDNYFQSGTMVGAMNFVAGAAAFTINPLTVGTNGFLLNGAITNSSANTQTINDFIILNGNENFVASAGGGNLVIGGTISGAHQVQKLGDGTLTITVAPTFSAGLVIQQGSVVIGSASSAGFTTTLGTSLLFNGGDGSITSVDNGTGSANLTFASLQGAGAGATGNFITIGGVNGTTNKIVLTASGTNTFLGANYYFGGSSYAWNDAGGFVRAIVYGTDPKAAPTITSPTVSITPGTNLYFQTTAAVTGQTNATMTTLNLAGTSTTAGDNDFTLATSGTLTIGGILRSGNVAGSEATISGGAGILSSAALYIRTDGTNDVLSINTNILASSQQLVKTGAGTLTLGGVNAYTGQTTVDNGTLVVTGTLGNTPVTVFGGTFALNSGSAMSQNTLTVNDPLSSVTENTNNGLAGTAAITESAGLVTLSSSNNYSGNMALTGGTLAFGSNGALGTGTLTFNVGTLDASSNSNPVINNTIVQTGNGIIGGTNALTLSGSFINNNNTWTVNNTALTTLSGVIDLFSTGTGGSTMTIQGTGNLVITGSMINGASFQPNVQYQTSGTVTVSGNNNTFTGKTTIGNNTAATSPTVVLGNPNALGSNFTSAYGNESNQIIINTGATLDLNGQTGFIKQLNSINGAGVNSNGALINSNTGTTATISNGLASVWVTAVGSGYSSVTPPTVTIVGGTAATGATQATAVASFGVTAATIGTVTVVGTFTTAPTVTISGGGGTGATATVSNAGVITITNPGYGYTSAPTVTFTGGAGGTSMSATPNPNSFDIVGLTITSIGAGYTTTNPTVTITSGSTAATASALSAFLQLNTASIGGPGNIIINADLAGGVLNKVGAGAVTLNGINTNTGNITISGGILEFATETSYDNNNLSHMSVSDLITNSGAVLAFGVGGSSPQFTAADLATITGTMALSTSSNGLENGSFLGLDTSAGNFTYTGTLANTNSGANAVGLVKLGANTLTLTGSNTYSGSTRIQNGGLTLGTGVSSLGALNPLGAVALGGSNSTTGATSGTLQLGDSSNPVNQTVSSLTVAANAGSANTVVGGFAAPSILTINNFSTDIYTGSLGGAGTNQNQLSLVKNGTGALTLAGNTTFIGSVTVNTGTLNLNGSNAFTGGLTINNSGAVVLGNSGALNSGTPQSVTFGAGATGQLQINGQNVTVGGLSTDTGAPGSPVVENNSSTPALLTINQAGNTTYAGTVQDGSTGALSITKAGAGALVLAGPDTYSGSTSVNGGIFQASGSLNSSNLMINSGGELALGTVATPAVLNLAGGISISGTAVFNIIQNGANDEIIAGGGLALASGATLDVTGGISGPGSYVLITYTGTNPSLSGVNELDLNGHPISSADPYYSITASSGSLVLTIISATAALPTITIASPAANARVMQNSTVAVSGTVGNNGPLVLNGTLSDAGGQLTVANFSPAGTFQTATNSTTAFSGTIAGAETGALGANTFGVTVTDPNAIPSSATASGTLFVVTNRVVTSTTGTLGPVHVGASGSTRITLSTTGPDSQFTRVTVADGGNDSGGNGISVTGGSPGGTFNSATSTDSRFVGGTPVTLGTLNGAVTLTTGSEGLAGESPINVTVAYTGNVFSGNATWNGSSGSNSWAFNNNWGDTAAGDINGQGAPGLAGAASAGDIAIFGDVAGESAATMVSLNGASPSLAGLTFNSGSTSYTIATGTGSGFISLQNGATISVTTGTATIAARLAGTGALTVSTAAGSDLIWSGSESYTGSANITTGTLTLVSPTTWLGQNAGTNIYNVNSGAVLQLNITGTQQDAVSNPVTIEGSGTVQVTGPGLLKITGPTGNGGGQNNLAISLSSGGVLEITNGVTLENGGGNPSTVNWTNNQGNLLLNPTAVIDTWDNPLIVGALTGSGTVTRTGFGSNGSGQGAGGNPFTVGAGNASGTFNGVITNAFGTINLTKEGNGLQVLTGSNSYSGLTTVQGGTLRITNNSALGFGDLTYVFQTGQHTTTVTGSATLDINSGTGALTVNNAITLNGGSLINGAQGTTSVLDSGIAGLTFTKDPQKSGAVVVGITGGNNSATATGASTSAFNSNGGGASGNPNLYVQVTNAGSGYTPSTAPTVSITQSGSTTGTDTAVVSSLTLVGANNFVGGGGNLQINAQILGTGGFTTTGTGTVILTNADIYSGSTGVAAGSTLQLGINTSGSDGTIASSAGVLDNGSLVYNTFGSYTYNGVISGSGSITLEGSGTQTFGGLNSSGTVFNNTALIFDTPGSQNLSGNITGAGSVTMSGTGNQIISGSNSYNGVTVVNSGTLQFGSTTAISKNTPSITVSGSGSLNFSNNVASQTTQLSTNGQTLALNNGSSLNFSVGNGTADQLIVSNGAVVSVTGTTSINLSALSPTATVTNFVIISDTAGFNFISGGTFTLGTLPSLATATLTESNTSVVVTMSSTIPVVYWTGGFGPPINSWVTNSNPGSNWTSDGAGNIPLPGMFGAQQDVVFSGSNNPTNQNPNVLGGAVSAHSLTINDPVAVVIQADGNTLTLGGVSGTTGINISATAGTDPNFGGQPSIGANILFTGNSNVTVSNTAGLLITGAISGSDGLVVNGTTILVLDGSNASTYTGGTQLISGTLQFNSDGDLGSSGSGNGVTFNPGAGNNATLQSGTVAPGTLVTAGNRTFTFASGTGTVDVPAGDLLVISGTVAGGGALNKVDSGELLLNGNVNLTGTATVTTGTLAVGIPGVLAQTGTSSTFNTLAGATLELSGTSAGNLATVAGDALTFTGSGTLLMAGNSTLQMHGGNGSNGAIYMDMTGGTIEVSGAGMVVQNGGTGGNGSNGNSTQGLGSVLWTGSLANNSPFTNLASLEIDGGAQFDTWNGNPVLVDALLGSGTLTRLGFSNTEAGSTVTIGVNNGSGEFDGVITNVFGVNSIIKTGTGTKIFTGSNSYSGSTAVNAGTLRITSNAGLGFGGPKFAGALTGTVGVSGSATLDLSGVTVNKVIALNGGSLINSNTATASVLDNGVAEVLLTAAGSTYNMPLVNITPVGGGSGAGANAGNSASPGGTNLYVNMTSAGSGYTVAPTVSISANGGTGSGATAVAILSSLTLTGTNNTLGGNGNLTINAQITGNGGFTGTGTGVLTLNGSNTYTGPTTVSTGTFVVNGSMAGNVTVNAGAALAGFGRIGGTISGAGLVAPADAPSIMSPAQVDPSGGTSFTFDFTQLAPTYSNASNSGNDVLHLTGATPFVFSLSSANTVTVDFAGASLAGGQLYLGGFFTDAGVNTATAGTPTFNYLNTGGFTIQYLGMVNVPSANFSTGLVTNGTEMEFQVVPEPGTYAMILGGFGILIAFRRLRRKS